MRRMAREEQTSPNDTSPDQGREAFVQEAVEYAQKTYDLGQELAAIQDEHARRREKHEEPKASQRRQIGHPAVVHRSQITIPRSVLVSNVREAVRQMEAMGFERH